MWKWSKEQIADLWYDTQQLNIYFKEKLFTKDLENEKKQVKKWVDLRNDGKTSNDGDASTCWIKFSCTIISIFGVECYSSKHTNNILILKDLNDIWSDNNLCKL